MYHIYILRSIPTGRYYVGSTSDIDQRLAKHNKGYSWFHSPKTDPSEARMITEN